MIVTEAPPAEPAALLSASLTVSLTETEKDQVRRRAKRAGLSMSAYARRRLTA